MEEILKPHRLDDSMIASIGFFDGVHNAHQALLKRTIELAKAENKTPVVITFDRHPKSVIFDMDFRYITPLDKKIALLKGYGIAQVFVLPFDKPLSEVPAETFIKDYLSGVHTLVCGFDFRFGHGGKGTTELLNEKADFNVHIMDEIRWVDQKIGSTLIRELIQAGKMQQVHDHLGRYFSIRGEVIHGEKKGRLIGYPTANIKLANVVTPKRGVYASITRIDDTLHHSMTSVGHNPTLNASHPLSVESYVFDFDRMIYGSTITTYFVAWLRDEQKFDSVKDLIRQIDADAEASKKVLNLLNLSLPSHEFML